MSINTWVHAEPVSWLDTNQFHHMKPASVMRIVWNGYAGLSQVLSDISRADYFAKTGWQPIALYFDITATGREVFVDQQIEARYEDRLGFAPGPRFGGVERIDLATASGDVATCRYHWLWFSPATNSLATEPVPHASALQDDELAVVPKPPDTSAAVEVNRFRWTVRESDINKHVNAAAYIERAENALADRGADVSSLLGTAVWFKRPSFVGDEMTARVLEADGAFVVDLVDAAGKSCCVLRFTEGA